MVATTSCHRRDRARRRAAGSSPSRGPRAAARRPPPGTSRSGCGPRRAGRATHEPGGTPLGEEVRRIVLHMRGMSDDLDPRADALLYAAGRAQHVARVIRPALERGEWVVCARFLDSSLAYQGAGYGNDLDELRRLQDFATDGLMPDLTLLLDVPVDIGLDRTRAAPSGTVSRTPRRSAFFERVRRRTWLRRRGAGPYRVMDGSGTVADADAGSGSSSSRCRLAAARPASADHRSGKQGRIDRVDPVEVLGRLRPASPPSHRSDPGCHACRRCGPRSRAVPWTHPTEWRTARRDRSRPPLGRRPPGSP